MPSSVSKPLPLVRTVVSPGLAGVQSYQTDVVAARPEMAGSPGSGVARTFDPVTVAAGSAIVWASENRSLSGVFRTHCRRKSPSGEAGVKPPPGDDTTIQYVVPPVTDARILESLLGPSPDVRMPASCQGWP